MKDELDTIEPVEATKTAPVEVRRPQAAPVVQSAKAEQAGHAPKPTDRPAEPRKAAIDEEDDEEGFFQRYRIGIIIGVIVLIGGSWVALRTPSGKSAPARKAPEP